MDGSTITRTVCLQHNIEKVKLLIYSDDNTKNFQTENARAYKILTDSKMIIA